MNLNVYNTHPQYISVSVTNYMPYQTGDLKLLNGELSLYTDSGRQSIPKDMFSISLTPAAINALDWASNKMKEEEDLKKMLQSNPVLESAFSQFYTLYLLCKDHEQF